MLENRQGACKSRILVNAPKDISGTSNEGVKVFAKEPTQVEGDGSFFPASEDEVIGVEQFLAEPKYNDLVDSVLDFDAFNLQKCFNVEELSAVEYGYIKTVDDATCSSLLQGEKSKNEFLDGKAEETNDWLSDGTNNLPDIFEDYLLNTGFDDKVFNPDYVPSKGSCMEDLDIVYHSVGSGGRQIDAEIVETSTARILMPEATCDQKSSLLDKMTIDGLHEAFRNVFGRETAVMDKQWLKCRISFGLQNLDMWNNGLSLPDYCVTSNDNEGVMNSSTSEEHSLRASDPFTGVFNFKTKPRVRRVKRGRHAGCISLKTLCPEVSKVVFGLPEVREKESILVKKKRLRKPTQRYIEESLEQNSRYQRRKCGISDTFSNDKILHLGSDKKQCQEGSRATPLVYGKEPFEGACIQVPFGIAVEKGGSKGKGHDDEDCQCDSLVGSSVDSGTEAYSAESQDDMSEDDCVTRTKTQKVNGRRKLHMVWSLPEVLKLVEGVSKHGVGRWTVIKKLLFPSSAHRTAVDLKDKWRNLLRACCKRSQSKRGAEPKRKYASHSVPQNILHRVRELAVIHPYPRERKTKVSQTVSIASSISASTCDNLLPLSTAVKV